MWSALHSCLHDLCAEKPLEGAFLQLFNSLQDWERATGDRRAVAEEEARAIIAEKQARLGATSMGIKSWFTSLGDAVKSVVNKIIDVFDVTFSGINAASACFGKPARPLSLSV